MAAEGAKGTAIDGGASAAQAPDLARRLARRRIGASHSRFVRLMKLVLPAAAGVLVLMIVAWPQIADRPEGFQLGASSGSLLAAGQHKLVNARYTGTDRRDNPFTITARAVAQNEASADEVDLQGPTADIFLGAGTWVAVTAPIGSYRKKDQILELTGGVDMFHDDGYEFHTEVAVVDLSAGVASGDHPVRGQGPFGRLRSNGFRILDGGQRVRFLGRSRLVLHPASGEAKP